MKNKQIKKICETLYRKIDKLHHIILKPGFNIEKELNVWQSIRDLQDAFYKDKYIKRFNINKDWLVNVARNDTFKNEIRVRLFKGVLNEYILRKERKNV